MVILCLNCGSSSVKYKMYDWKEQEPVAEGVVERVGTENSYCSHRALKSEKVRIEKKCSNHYKAIELIMKVLTDSEHSVVEDTSKISAVGHRVVHGGEEFKGSVMINDRIIDKFEELTSLAPLHNPPNIQGIKAARKLMPGVPHMAIMDTAWHQTMPEHAYMYALPYQWYEEHGIRRYGFHGTSLLYVSRRASVLLGKDPFECNLIICHIGNGVSLNAVKNGVSYDTSMGFTPLEGLIMGTRAGDHDAAIDLFMMDKENYSTSEMDSILNKKSGIFGITGKFIDRRDVLHAAREGNRRAQLAVNMECYRLRKYIGAYIASLGKIDALVFTAGVGEMSPEIRAGAMKGLGNLGVKFDEHKNKIAKTGNAECDITAPDSDVKIFTIPTDEERVFIEDVVALYRELKGSKEKYIYRFQLPDYRNELRDRSFKEECREKPELADVRAVIPDNPL